MPLPLSASLGSLNLFPSRRNLRSLFSLSRASPHPSHRHRRHDLHPHHPLHDPHYHPHHHPHHHHHHSATAPSSSPMTRTPVTDARRLATAVDRLDAVSPLDREAAAKHVFDVCVYHVTRVRKSHPAPHPRGHGRHPALPSPTPHFVFDIVHPHIYRIARRLDRAMRYAETSPHPADAAALIVAVDAQGALAALFAVAQNAGVHPADLDALALPLRKRSAPALLRTLFSPDMRVANAAKKALRQVIAIACCQNTPWMTTIRSALSLRSATRINRSVQLRNLLARLADILHLVVRQAAAARTLTAPDAAPRKRNSKSSLNNLMGRPRSTLSSERRAAERYATAAAEAASAAAVAATSAAAVASAAPNAHTAAGGVHTASPPPPPPATNFITPLPKRRPTSADSLAGASAASAPPERRSLRNFFRRRGRRRHAAPAARSAARVSLDAADVHPDRQIPPSRRRFRGGDASGATSTGRRAPRADSMEETHSVASCAVSTGGGSYPGSIFSSITESQGAGVTVSRAHNNNAGPRRAGGTIKRDAATAMYIFERLLAKRTNPELEDRVEVISTLADIASVTFTGHYATSHKIDHSEEYSEAMAAVFSRHGQKIYSVVLDILFRPVRETDANTIGVFSFQETGIVEFCGSGGGVTDTTPYTRRKLAEFPQSAICLPNMDCNGLAAVSCNSLLKVLLRYVPQVCSQRLAMLTGTINSAFLHSSEALQRSQDGLSWDVSKIVSAVDALTVLVATIPPSVESALELIIREPVTLRLVIETCIRSISATGRLLAQNAARPSAPKLSDEGTLDSLRSWQALIRVIPGTSSWSGTPSYSSSILFLAQVARRAALISVMQGYRKEKYSSRSAAVPAEGSTSVSEEATTLQSHSIGTTVLNNGNSPDTENGSPEIEGIGPSSPSSTTIAPQVTGFDGEEDNALTAELHKCIIAMISMPGTSAGDVFFELYRTVVYLYARDLKQQQKRLRYDEDDSCGMGSSSSQLGGMRDRPTLDKRTQSDEDAKGVLVENIAVDGQLPSRALRRAVMASELDLGSYFDRGQPPSLEHLNRQQTGVAAGMHTFEEFSHALAFVLGTLSNKTITENFEDPQEAAVMISRDVQRSGSGYLKRVHKRAKSILRRDMLNQDYDWRSVKYEERIRRLEEQVASLRLMMQSSLGESVQMSRRKSLPKILGMMQDGGGIGRNGLDGQAPLHEFVCGPSRCFCVA